ncbi:MAG: hypothetical protein M3R46_13060 [Actinomycetota bacterium]|jgi:hypothetical protein|nr:hypothetical protein [Actinomycetota bacterium]
MGTYRFTPSDPSGTGELVYDDPSAPPVPITNAAPDLAAPEMAVGVDDFNEPAQALATGVTIVSDAH